MNFVNGGFLFKKICLTRIGVMGLSWDLHFKHIKFGGWWLWMNENLKNNGVLDLKIKMRVNIGRVIWGLLKWIVSKGFLEKLIGVD